MIYELTCLRPPFLGDNFPSLKRAVISGRYPSIPKNYSDSLGTVINLMLQVHAKDRPNAKAFLNHPLIASKLVHEIPCVIVPREQRACLMETIKIPSLHNLNRILPRPRYPDSRPISPKTRQVEDQKPRSASAPPPVMPTGLVGGRLQTKDVEKSVACPDEDSNKENDPVQVNVAAIAITEIAKEDACSNQENVAAVRRHYAAPPAPRAPLVARPSIAHPHRPFQVYNRIW